MMPFLLGLNEIAVQDQTKASVFYLAGVGGGGGSLLHTLDPQGKVNLDLC